MPKHDEGWRAKWEAMTTALDNADEGQLEWDRNLNRIWWLIGGVVLTAFAAGFVIYVLERHSWSLPVIFGAIALALAFAGSGNGLRRLAPESRERSSKWESFQRWTHDFHQVESARV